MARCRRMRSRQPDVQRHDARLGAETDQQHNEHQVAQPVGNRPGDGPKIAEGKCAGKQVQGQKGQRDEQGGDMGHHHINEAGCAHIFPFMFEHDQAKRHQRHQFPGQQKCERVIHAHHQRHRQQEQVETAAQKRNVLFIVILTDIACGVDRHHRRQQRYHQQKKCCQTVQSQRQVQPARNLPQRKTQCAFLP